MKLFIPSSLLVATHELLKPTNSNTFKIHGSKIQNGISSTFILVTSVTYLSVIASTTTAEAHFVVTLKTASNSGSLDVAQAIPTTIPEQLPLRRGSKGVVVADLQIQLKQLGYYDSAIDGLYGKSTQTAVSQFQKAVGLIEDGIVGPITWNTLQAAQAKKTPPPASTTIPQRPIVERREQTNWLWYLVSAIVLGVGGLLYLLKQFAKSKNTGLETPSEQVRPILKTAEYSKTSAGHIDANSVSNSYNSSVTGSKDSLKRPTAQPTIDVVAVKQTTRAKINIVDELIKGLDSPNPTRQLMAIWDLGQEGDARAVQPLVKLMLDSGSQQRSLILIVLAEIGSRALKPMNRVATSLQDQNAEVRENAIGELTRTSDLIIQITQVLSHGVEDPDLEVQETARYALLQINRLRELADYI